MALGGKYPVLLVGLIDVLTPTETQLLKRLSTMSYPTGATATAQATIEAQKAANDATVAALKSRASASATLSSLLTRLPIILDGEIIPASATNYSALMVKQLSVFEGANTTTQAANTVSINIKTSRSAKNSIFTDLLFSVADVIFSKSDIAPSISYFGGSVAIPNGYLIRLSRRGSDNSTEEVITLEIAKDLSFLFGEMQDFYAAPEGSPAVINASDSWTFGG